MFTEYTMKKMSKNKILIVTDSLDTKEYSKTIES